MSVVQIRDEGPNWGAKALVDFLSPLISDAIKQQQQRDANRKNNAFLGEFAKLMNGGQQPTNLLTEQGTNGWENAFNQSGNSALSQFDANTAGIAPQATPQQAKQQPITQTDLLQIFGDLIGNKRFSGMNTADAFNMVAPYFNASENARQEMLKKELADAVMKSPDAAGRLGEIWGGAIRNLIPYSAVDQANAQYQYANPHKQPYLQNTGATTRYGTFNPATGDYTQAGEYTNTLTPQQVADNDFRNRQLTTQDAQFTRNLAQQKEQFNKTLDYNRKQANRPKYTYQYGDDGRLWKLDQFGNGGPIDPNSVSLSNYEKQKLSTLQETRKGLLERLKQLRLERENEVKNISGGVASGLEGSGQKSPELQRIDDELSQVKGQLDNVDAQINQIFQNKETPSQPVNNSQSTSLNASRLGTGTDIGANMLGHANNGVISSSYGTPRTHNDGTKYNHTGTDYPAKKGTPILVPDAGTRLTVADVVKGHAGYGNYVDLEGNLNGHKIWFRIGHMDNGSIRVQKGQEVLAGDVIGGVGNTGNIRGKNGGYHMHLEAKIDGQRVDPVKFLELITPYISREITGQQAQKLRAQQNSNSTQPGGKILFKHPNGQTVNEAEFSALQSTRNQPADQVRAALMQEGFAAYGDTASANTPTPNVTSSDVSVANSEVSSVSPDVSSKIRKPAMTSPDITNRTVQTNPKLDMRPSYQKIGMSPALTAPVNIASSRPKIKQTQDNIAWRTKDGRVMATTDGRLMTQELYEGMCRKADAGVYSKKGINSRADFDAYLTKLGGVKTNPAEIRAVDRLNGNRTTQPDTTDPNTAQLPPDPKTSPEKFSAPIFTDNINHTTDADTQELLSKLNGLTQDESDFAEYYNRKLNRLMGNPDFHSNMMERVRRERLNHPSWGWPDYLPPRDAFEPYNPYDFPRL